MEEHALRCASQDSTSKLQKTTQTDDQSGMTVEVYTNPGEPDILRQINQAIAQESGDDDSYFGGGSSIRIDTTRLAQAAYADGANTTRTGNVFFGPLDDKRIAITQQSAWFSGQSWPTLVYLPYLAFVGSTTRHMMGFGMETADFVDQVGAHEVAHQWWGQSRMAQLSRPVASRISPNSHPAWSQARKVTAPTTRYEKLEEHYREDAGSTVSNDQAGPITEGPAVDLARSMGYAVTSRQGGVRPPMPHGDDG